MNTNETSPVEAVPSRRFPVTTALIVITVLALAGLMGWSLLRQRENALTIGKPAPEFSLQTFDGELYELAQLRGKIVVLNFWASWCTTCDEEAAILEAYHQTVDANDVVILGVDYSDTEKEALAYLAEHAVTYPNGPDLGTRISEAYRLRGVPETYVIGRDGMLMGFQIGPFIDLAQLETLIQSARP